jgi:hypothetical protein
MEHRGHPIKMAETFLVRCHGAEQITTLTYLDLMRAKSVDMGVAFEAERLRGPA